MDSGNEEERAPSRPSPFSLQLGNWLLPTVVLVVFLVLGSAVSVFPGWTETLVHGGILAPSAGTQQGCNNTLPTTLTRTNQINATYHRPVNSNDASEDVSLVRTQTTAQAKKPAGLGASGPQNVSGSAGTNLFGPRSSWSQDQINALGLSFRMWPPASLSPRVARGWGACPDGVRVPFEPLDPTFGVLLVAGARKGGTTWLFDVLAKRRRFLQPPDKPPLMGGWPGGKEPHYFDADALPENQTYASMFPEAYMAGRDRGRVLLDVTPAYMINPKAAVRAAAIVPHARIVMLVRDPVARFYSDFRMMHNPSRCRGQGPACYGGLAQSIRDFVHWSPKECKFTTPGANVTWQSCQECVNTNPANPGCTPAKRATGKWCDERLTRPHPFHVSAYAPIIAWWLAFFPPEQFLIISSSDLHVPGKRAEVLNAILDHAGLPHAPRFTEAEVAAEAGFVGASLSALPSSRRVQFQRVRNEIGAHVRDFDVLMHAFFPHLNVTFPFEAVLR